MSRWRKKMDERMKSDAELKEKFKHVEFEKNDTKALFIAAMITFIPPVIACLAIIYFFIWLIFLR